MRAGMALVVMLIVGFIAMYNTPKAPCVPVPFKSNADAIHAVKTVVNNDGASAGDTLMFPHDTTGDGEVHWYVDVPRYTLYDNTTKQMLMANGRPVCKQLLFSEMMALGQRDTTLEARSFPKYFVRRQILTVRGDDVVLRGHPFKIKDEEAWDKGKGDEFVASSAAMNARRKLQMTKS